MGKKRSSGQHPQQMAEPAQQQAPAGMLGLDNPLLNMPLQQQLQMMQQGMLSPIEPLMMQPQNQFAVGGGDDEAAASPPSGGRGRKTPAQQRPAATTPVRHSDREPTKGLATSTNKPLSSKFRGVCWNRKNRRWQAAINSGGACLSLDFGLDWVGLLIGLCFAPPPPPTRQVPVSGFIC